MACSSNYGTLSLLRADGSSRASFPLLQTRTTIGRTASNDVRILLPAVSKLHCTIEISPIEPFEATLNIFSINGCIVNSENWEAGETTMVKDGDLIMICDRTFRFEKASQQVINVDSPPPSQRRPLRYSLINSARVNTPSKSPAVAEQEVQEADLLGWDEEPNVALDGKSGDLITWDEWETEELEEVEQVLEDVEVAAEMEQENVIAGTPIRERFSMTATPSLAHRSRAQIPASAPRLQLPSTPLGTPQRRRRSMRMTIVASEGAASFVAEREAVALAREIAFQAQSPKPITPFVSPIKSPSKIASVSQGTPSRSSNPSTPRSSSAHSTPRVASATSSTSRRISALLLSAKQPLIFSEETGQDDLEESDSSEDEVEMNVSHYAQQAEELEAEFEDVNLVSGQFDDEEESRTSSGQSILMNAVGVPLPDSPYGSPTATPIASTQNTPSLRRNSLSRNLSLRERLLIRSAHKNLISATASPIPVASPSIIMAPITVENETTEEEEEEEVEEQQIIVIASPTRSHRDSLELSRVQSPAPASETVVVESAFKASPASARRISGNFARVSLVDGEKNSPVASGTPVQIQEEVELSEQSFDAPASPSPVERTPVRVVAPRPRASSARRAAAAANAANAAAIALPVTPAGTSSWTPKQQTPRVPVVASTPVQIEMPSFKFDTPEPIQFQIATATPILSGLNVFPSSAAGRPRVNTPRPVAPAEVEESDESFEAEVSNGRPEFKSQMTSPVHHHRTMATPKSALRVGMADFTNTGRRNPFTSTLFSFTAPATLKRKVAFNEEVYIQEILDIRDPQIHWNEAIDRVDPASIPLPDSPAVFRAATPRRPATPARVAVAEGTPIRRAQRVVTDNPPESVQRILMMNQPSPRRVASRSTPAPGPAPGPAHITEGLEQPTPVKEVSVRKASRVVLPITPGEVKDASPTKQRASRRVSTNSTTPVAAIVSTPRSVVIMRADRAVIDTPIAKKIIIEPSVSAVAIRKANIQKLMESPAPRLSNYDAIPKSAPRPIVNKAPRAQARRQSMPSLEVVTPQVVAVEPAVAPIVEPEAEPIVEVEEPIVEVEGGKISTPIPAAKIQKVMPIPPTPSFVGIRSLFAPVASTTTLLPKTPNFSGFTNLFSGSPTTVNAIATPQFSGVKEMMQSNKVIDTPQFNGMKEMMQTNKTVATPRFAGIRGLFVGTKDKVGINVEEGDLAPFELPVEKVVEEEEILPQVEEVIVEVEPVVEIEEVVEDVEAEPIVVEAAPIEVMVEEQLVEEEVVPVIEEKLMEEPIVEVPVEEAIEVVEPVLEAPMEPAIEVIEVEEPILETPVLEAQEPVVEPAKKPIIEAAIEIEEEAEEEPAPVARRGRIAKVVKTPVVKAKPAPKRTARQIKADLLAAQAEKEVDVVVEEVEEVVEEIISKPIVKTRTSRAKATPKAVPVKVVPEPIAEVEAEIVEEVVEEIEEVIAPVKKAVRGSIKTPVTVASTRRSGRSARQDVSEDVVEEEIEVKPVRSGRKVAVKKTVAVKVVEELEEVEEPIVVEEEPVVEKKATRAKRTPKAAVVIHEDISETPISKPIATRVSRAKVVPLQPTSASSSLEEIIIPVPTVGKGRKSIVVEIDDEPEQENKVVKKAPVKRAVKKVAVVEEVVAPVRRSTRR